jgi:tetratricopeptide (TPR) repeat protein
MIVASMKDPAKQSSLSPLTYFDLGSYHRPITTSSEDAQTWFDRGLIWVYGFNHEEAAKCFEKAIAADTDCAMAYWGLAYALGPNYNKPWDVFDELERTTNLKRTNAAARQAEKLSTTARPQERALIRAIQSRYPQERPAEDFSMWNKQYAEAMESVYKEFSSDIDIAALYADALMNLTAWALWDIRTGEPTAGSRVLEAKQVLDDGIATEDGFKHPGLLHSYIHLMEMSSTPEKALTIADRLRDLVPDAGHLRHMPSRKPHGSWSRIFLLVILIRHFGH